MAYDVTTWFNDQVLLQAPANIVRKFTIGSSDYSSRVMTWPSFNRSWDDVRPISTTLQLANADGAMSLFRDDSTNLQRDCLIELGFTHATSGDELITLFSGKVDRVKYAREIVSITVIDKFKQLTERIVGQSDAPVSFISSNYLPSDLLWYLVTSYGGYSAVQSTSNPDLDYASFLTWAEVFSESNVTMNAEFTGQPVAETIRKLARLTYSAIFIAEDKLNFHRFSLVDTNVSSLTAANIDDLVVYMDDAKIVNKQYVFADYVPASSQYGITIVDQNSSSVNSFGLREHVEKDEVIWYANSIGALDLAQRKVLVEGVPYDHIQLNSFLPGIARLIGETIFVDDAFHSIQQSYRIMSHKINMDTLTTKFNVNRAQLFNSFILDTSSLDGTDVLT